MRVLVHGLAIAGAATVRALGGRGHEVIAFDDRIDDGMRALATSLGIELRPAPTDAAGLDALLAQFDLVVPAPGVPEDHALVLAAGRVAVPLASEIELAYRWEQERDRPRPVLAVTGTDGKTTTTLLAASMLAAGGLRTVASGNTDVPMVEAVELDLDAHVVECTSFRLAWTEHFRADAAVWLNLAPDHLNWHRSMESYIAAKARLFDLQGADDVAIGFRDDEIVMRHLATAPGRHVTFGARDADYRVEGGWLVGPRGRIAEIASMRRALPHDLTNALAASAMVLEPGLVGPDAVAAALATFDGPPHRIEPVGEFDGVRWFNDSKATTPHAASVAISAFERVVLIAGGRNKGLDLSSMAAASTGVRQVIAIGESAGDIEDAFRGTAPVVRAESMLEAVELARDAARPGDVVLLSPGCASFDWYPDGGYPARGDDFRTQVARLREGITS